MRMAVDQIPAVLVEYLDEVLIPKSASNTQTFMSAFVIGLAGQRAKAMAAGLADSNGMIDLEEIRAAAMNAISKSGNIDIPALGYKADREDIERLFQIANRHGS